MAYKKYKYGGHSVPGMYSEGGAFGNSMGGGKPIRRQKGGPGVNAQGDTLREGPGRAPQIDPSKMTQKQMTDAERKFMMDSMMMKKKGSALMMKTKKSMAMTKKKSAIMMKKMAAVAKMKKK